MPTVNYGITLNVGGVSVGSQIAVSGDHPNPYEVPLPVGKAGTLTTRTDNDTGVATVASGHGVTTSDKVDIYWSGGIRYGMTVTATTSTTISVDAGAGDNLPVATTALVVSKQVAINTAIDGDNIQIIGIVAAYPLPSSTALAHVDFQSAAPASIAPLILNANKTQVSYVAGGADNPFTVSPIVVCYASNGSATETCTLRIASLEDSTP